MSGEQQAGKPTEASPTEGSPSEPAAGHAGNAGRAGRPEHRHTRGLAHQLVDVARDAAEEASELGERIVDVASPIADRVARTGAAAGRLISAAAERGPGQRLARLRALRRRNRTPLENLFDVHPEARRAPRRELGVMTIPVSRIRGTAVEGPPQRGGDFLPLPFLKSTNWQARWQRLRQAQDRLAVLPPIDVLQTHDGYWVVDGHNRVALALYGNQDDIDADVTHVHLPGTTDDDVRVGSLASVLEESRQLRAVGQGRLTRGGALRDEPVRARPRPASLEEQAASERPAEGQPGGEVPPSPEGGAFEPPAS
ncbi:MAG TPA: hypothetical protein VNL94_01150 [Candidatus Binatia bacterium]|nr:hypothetical protein [Candidatus Binatia bacterium]